MLDSCAAHGVIADIEVISAVQINAYRRVFDANVRYRFVLDNQTSFKISYDGTGLMGKLMTSSTLTPPERSAPSYSRSVQRLSRSWTPT